MAIFYYTKQMFPHVSVEIHDYSLVSLPSSPLDNTCRQLSPVFADMGPDDRTMVCTMETQFTELYGKQTYKRHGLIGKACIRNLRAGGWTYVRRLTDNDSKNANASLDVLITPANTTAPKKYYDLKLEKWVNEQPAGTVNTDYIEITMTKTPVISYQVASHQNIKTKADAELITPSQNGTTDVIPAYVLMRTGAGILGNKTEIYFQKMRNVTDKGDALYQMDLLISDTQKERYKVTSVEDARYNETIPVNIEQVVKGQSYQLNVVHSQANMDKLAEKVLDALGKLVEDLEAGLGAVASDAIAKAALEAEIAKVKVLQTALDEDDIPVTAITNIFSANMRFPFVSELLEDGNYIEKVKLGNGTNGKILKGKFDWNLQVTPDGASTPVKIYESLCKSFFEGALDPTVLDFNETPVDIIYDIGYPQAVKEMIGKYTSIPQRRDVMATLCPPRIASIAELKSFDEGFKMTNYMVLKEVNWTDYYDTDEQKTINVPMTYLMINAIVEFFKDGWSNPILANRIVAGPVTGTVTPVINILTDIQDKTYLVSNGWNYVSSSKLGYYLDGQKTASADPYKVSVLQEFHNGVLIGRIMKKITDTLNRNKHFLQTEAGVANVQAIVNEDLEEFRSKCASINYQAYYEDNFAQAEGLLSHSVDLHLYGSNKSHKLILNAYRHLVSTGN